VPPEGLDKFKKLHLVGNRTRVLPVCSIVPPTSYVVDLIESFRLNALNIPVGLFLLMANAWQLCINFSFLIRILCTCLGLTDTHAHFYMHYNDFRN
jgi:hypothetical protein